jgi:hypothetical protein
LVAALVAVVFAGMSHVREISPRGEPSATRLVRPAIPSDGDTAFSRAIVTE